MHVSVVRFVDVGCGFGGLTIALATLYPDRLVLGLEIRAKVLECILSSIIFNSMFGGL